MSTTAIAQLLETLDLKRLDATSFEGDSPKVGWQRVYGGQVVAQALVAAIRSVTSDADEARPVHSLHAYFMLPGDPDIPIRYEVDPIRDGRSFSTRRVVAKQNGAAIFLLAASFHRLEPGYDHQMDAPPAANPETLPGEAEFKARFIDRVPENVRRYFLRDRPIELRPADIGRWISPKAKGERGPETQQMWFRATGQLPDDPALHQAVLAYASDMTLIETALLAHGHSVFDPEVQVASLDHAVWFHRPARADDWLLYQQDTPSASGGRGLARGLVYDLQGRLVASVMQEGLMRIKK